MNPTELFPADISSRVCLALLHSLWQVPLLALIAALAIGLLRHCSARVSYMICVAAMLMSLAAMPVTYWKLTQADLRVVISPLSTTDATDDGPVAAGASQSAIASRQSDPARLSTSRDSGTDLGFETELASKHGLGLKFGTGEHSSLLPPSVQRWQTYLSHAMPWRQLARWTVVIYALGVLWMMSRLAVASLAVRRYQRGRIA